MGILPVCGMLLCCGTAAPVCIFSPVAVSIKPTAVARLPCRGSTGHNQSDWALSQLFLCEMIGLCPSQSHLFSSVFPTLIYSREYINSLQNKIVDFEQCIMTILYESALLPVLHAYNI